MPNDVRIAEQRALIDRYVDWLAAEKHEPRARVLANKVEFFRWQLRLMLDGTYPGFQTRGKI